jgi:hypothetical protein
MRRILLCALVASSLALPALAQPTWIREGVLIEPRHPTTSEPIRLTVVGLANMTTVELEIEVTHCPPDAPPAYCITKTCVQPPGQHRNFLDTSTFFGEL